MTHQAYHLGLIRKVHTFSDEISDEISEIRKSSKKGNKRPWHL